MSNRPTQRTIQVDVEVNQQTYVQVGQGLLGRNKAFYSGE
jgi:hypothetical protein